NTTQTNKSDAVLLNRLPREAWIAHASNQMEIVMISGILQDKNVVVFGAGGSIGAAVAKEFALEGAQVFLAGRTQSNVESVANHIAATGGRAGGAALDPRGTNAAHVNLHQPSRPTWTIPRPTDQQSWAHRYSLQRDRASCAAVRKRKIRRQFGDRRIHASARRRREVSVHYGPRCGAPYGDAAFGCDHFFDRKPCPRSRP